MADTKPTRFDAHCHVFNLDYLFLEAGNMLKDAILSGLPKFGMLAETPVAVGSGKGIVQDVMEFLRWLKQLGESSLGSEQKNLDQVLGAVENAWNDDCPVAAVPLMMDIFYMFSKELKAPGSMAVMAVRSDAASYPDGEPEPRLELDEAQLEDVLAQVTACFQEAGIDEVRTEFVRQNLREAPMLVQAVRSARDAVAYYETKGFVHHRDALISLKNNPMYKDRMFPFFAVDPRRPNVVKAVIAESGGFVGKSADGKPFQGIKLYPRLGYEPGCVELRPLFAWCQKHSIPIVSHCNSTGFPPIGGDGSLGDPLHWEPVLAEFPKLILDLAHFGSNGNGWPQTILKLMRKYDNVYSDVACYTDPDDPQKFHDTYWNHPDPDTRSAVRRKTLFGTDFDVFYFTHVNTTLQNYHARFKQVFQADMAILVSDNPRRFLDTVI